MLKKNLKRAKFKAIRSGWINGMGERITDSCNMREAIDDKTVDDAIYGDSFMVYTEEDFEKIVQDGLAQKAIQRDGEELGEPNFIFDVFVLHDNHRTFPDGEPFPIRNSEKIPAEQCRSGLQSSHDFFRNQGANYNEKHVDTGINIGMGNVYHVNCSEIWGDEWDENGVSLQGGGGISASTIMYHCRTNISNTYRDPKRAAVFTYPRLSGSNTVTGFAWVGVSGTSTLNAIFVKSSYFGDDNYKREGDPEFTLADPNNKTTHHEMGHLFGLYHTFNNTTTCDAESNPLLQGDRVADTIPHPKDSRCGIPLTENPHNNIMSYSWRTWRVAITEGQKERMHAVLINQQPAVYDNPYYEWEANVIKGCTDPTASNYNPLATENDGSCDYRKKGCIDPNFVEYDPEAELMEWGACKTPHVDGCTDPNANNYNPSATRNDGSCTYDEVPVDVLGCTDPKALNYNPNATKDDNSCKYAPEPILGCTDPTANNYNPLATENDGSCEYNTGPQYIEDSLSYFNTSHYFSFVAKPDFVGELFTVMNVDGIKIPIVYDECGNNNLSCILNKLSNGNIYVLTSITDQYTGIVHPQDNLPLIFHEGNIMFDFSELEKGLIIKNLNWDDYSISILQYQKLPQQGLMTHAVKRIGWPNSPFILVTREDRNGELCWHNTQGNNIFYGGTLDENDYNSIIAAKDTGLFVDGEKKLDSKSPKDGVNTSDLVIGYDPKNSGRICGAYVAEVIISNQSIPEDKVANFEFSRKIDLLTIK